MAHSMPNSISFLLFCGIIATIFVVQVHCSSNNDNNIVGQRREHERQKRFIASPGSWQTANCKCDGQNNGNDKNMPSGNGVIGNVPSMPSNVAPPPVYYNKDPLTGPDNKNPNGARINAAFAAADNQAGMPLAYTRFPLWNGHEDMR